MAAQATDRKCGVTMVELMIATTIMSLLGIFAAGKGENRCPPGF